MPFGTTTIQNICNQSPKNNYKYIICFDQEPIDLNRHGATLDHIYDLEKHRVCQDPPLLIVSEKDSTMVHSVCHKYRWQSRYYFFHGWAALDWYRGYQRTPLLIEPRLRDPRVTFMSPNRIIGGDRWHRVIMMYHLVRLGLVHNHISMPEWCPVEGSNIGDIAGKFTDTYPDIQDVFVRSPCFPMCMPGESDQPQTSYRLDLWDTVADSMVYLVTETVADGERLHLTEKIFKPIALGMPFLLLSTQGSLAYLRTYGFRTFGDFWDESYDQEADVYRRCEKIAQILLNLDRMSVTQKRELWRAMLPTIEHNQKHFYSGAFESVLSEEFDSMLASL